jgi:DNA-binding MarR family transcriptional regulator
MHMVSRLKDEIGKRKAFDSLEQEVFLNLLRTSDALMRDVEMLLKPAGLSSTQYNVLRILRGAGDDGLPCGEVAERMITHDPDMTRLLDRLEKRGLIARSRQADDRRVVKASITRDGLETLRALDQPVRQLHEKQLSHLGEKKLHMLMKLLEETRATQG